MNWKWLIRKTVTIVFLSFALYAFVALLFVSLSPLTRQAELLMPISSSGILPAGPPPCQQLDFWTNRLRAPSQPLTRTVTISVTAELFSFDFDLWITPTHPLYSEVHQGQMDDPACRTQFVQAAFGNIGIRGIPWSNAEYSIPKWYVDNTTHLVNINISATRNESLNSLPWMSIERQQQISATLPIYDAVVVQLDGARLIDSSMAPTNKTDTLVVIPLNQSGLDQPIFLRFGPLSQDLQSAPSPSPAESRQSFLNRLGDTLNLPFVSALLFSLVEALPLLIFLKRVPNRRHANSRVLPALAKAVSGLLLFHFALYYLAGSSDLTYKMPWLADVATSIARTFKTIFPSPDILTHLLWNAPYRTAPVILGILLPVWLSQRAGWHSARADTPTALAIRASTVLLPLGAVVSITGYALCLNQWNPRGLPLYIYVFAASALFALLIWVTLWLLFRQISRAVLRPGTLWLATLVLFMNAALEPLYDWAAWRAIVWFILTFALGMSLLVALTRLVRTLRYKKILQPHLPRWGQVLLVLGVIGVVLPMGNLIRASSQIAFDTDVFNLAYRLDDWIPFVWLGGLLFFLHQRGQGGQELDSTTLTLGIIGASTLLYDPLARWLWVPLTFLIGWFMLSWLVRPVDYGDKLQHFFLRVFKQRTKLLDDILELNIAESSYKQLRKKLGDKLAKGEESFTLAKYDKQLLNRKKELDRLRKKTQVKNKPVKEVALTFGPYPSAWKNAIHGTKLALLFASPWLVLYLREFLSSSTPQDVFLLWGFAHDLILILLKWGVFGFVFGYFYPYLRGKDGLEKGWGLFLITVLPALPLMIIFSTTSADWQARLFWVLQVFTQCTLLGLVAFDYATLRQGRLDWDMLFEVHGMTGVGVSVSSIVVAVGATITTLLTSQATSIISLALKFILPQVPTDLLPK